MSDTFDEIGYTMEQEDACWEALKKWGLLPGVNEKKTRFEIVTTVVDLRENLVVQARAVKHRLKAMRDGLHTFMKAYAQDDVVGEALKLHLDKEGLPPTPEDNLYIPERYVARLLSAVRQAQTQPMHLMIAFEQTKGLAFRRTVWKLLEIFEQDTGVRPTVSADSTTEDGITGNASAFLIACLAPANLVDRKVLGSTILATYKEWIDARRPSPHAPSTT